MRDYAELSKSVHCCVDCQCEICPRGDTPFGYIECKRKLADDTADAIEELLAAVPRWISVEEHPIPYDWVWGVYRQTVCGKVMQHHITVRMHGDNIIDQDGNIYNGFISHWMPRLPLPEPPKEDADNG